jgi:SAM-dependent methyltransferase
MASVTKAMMVGLYRKLPGGMRRRIQGIGVLDRLRQRYIEGDTKLHNLFYHQEYYQDCFEHKWAIQSAPLIISQIANDFQIGSVIDVGCGAGEYLDEFRKRGLEVHGVELAEAALRLCHERGLEVVPLDLTAPEAVLPWTADLVCSFEVAEHLHEQYARNFVRILTTAARRHVVMTAALPGQPGLCHFNCQPKEYWIARFAERGFKFDEERTARWEQENLGREIAPWFQQNLMIFHKA